MRPAIAPCRTTDEWDLLWQEYVAQECGFTSGELQEVIATKNEARLQELLQGSLLAGRRDPPIFLQSVLRDSRNNMIRMGAIHYTIQRHISWCRENGYHAGILAPFGHGKTEQVAIGRTLWEIGQDPDIRAKLVCNIDDNAKIRLGSIKAYCEQNAWVGATFPHLSRIREASKHRLNLEAHRATAKDATLESWGITSAGIGARADLIVYDDPVDERSLRSKLLREDAKSKFYGTWQSRLEPTGFAIYIATTWHHHDLTADLRHNNEQFCFLVMEISADYSCIECSCDEMNAQWRIPLWGEKWDAVALKAKHKEIGSSAFERGFRQKPMADEDAVFKVDHFKWFDRGSWNREKRTIRHPETGKDVKLKIYQACDLAISKKEVADYFASGTLGVADNGDAFLLDVWRARLSFPAQRDSVIRQAIEWNPERIGIEVTQYQDALRQAILEVTRLPIKRLSPVKDKRTRASKASLQVENGKVYLPGRVVGQGIPMAPDDRRVPGIRAFLHEIAIFQGAGDEHDDQIDMFGYLLELSRGTYRPRAQSIRGV